MRWMNPSLWKWNPLKRNVLRLRRMPWGPFLCNCLGASYNEHGFGHLQQPYLEGCYAFKHDKAFAHGIATTQVITITVLGIGLVEATVRLTSIQRPWIESDRGLDASSCNN